MAPSKPAAASSPYEKGEKTLCFHHDMLYEAKILDVRPTEDGASWQYKIHYKGWKNTWDDWVPADRVRKFTPDNQDLARQLHNQMKALQSGNKKSALGAKKGGARTNGSDFSSARGSEERHASVAATGRGGQRRLKDFDLENTIEEDAPSAWGRSRDKFNAPVQRVSVVSGFSYEDIVPSIYDPDETEEEDWPAVYGKKHASPSAPNNDQRKSANEAARVQNFQASLAATNNASSGADVILATSELGQRFQPPKFRLPLSSKNCILKGSATTDTIYKIGLNTGLLITVPASASLVKMASRHLRSTSGINEVNKTPVQVESSTLIAEETIERAPTRRESRRLAGQKKENTQPGNQSNVSTKERMGSSFILKLKLREDEPILAVHGSSSWTLPITTIPKSQDNSLPSLRSNDSQDSRTKIVNDFQKSAATTINSVGRKVRSFHTMRSDEDRVGLDPAIALPTQSTGPPHKRQKLSTRALSNVAPTLLEPQVLESSLRSMSTHSNESRVTTGSSGTMTGPTPALEYDPDATDDENEVSTIEKTVPLSDLSRLSGPEPLSPPPKPVRQRKIRRGQDFYVVTIDDTASSTLPEQRFTRRKPAPSWADPKSNEWDCVKFLQSEYAIVEDPLLRLPDPNHSYIDRNGRLKDPDKYAHYAPKQPRQYLHPKLAQHLKNGTDTFLNRRYYQDPHSIPIAGIRRGAGKDTKGSPIPDDFGPYEEKPDFDQYLDLTYGDQCDFDLVYDIDSINANPNRAKQESDFQHKPMVKLIIPDYIKAILVDDWENVTKNQQLVPLPSERPVNKILDDYFEEEADKRDNLSSQKILEEVVAGLKEYFDKCLGRILLYRFERPQYVEIRNAREAGSTREDLSGKSVGEIYGAEHLCRLIVTLPELICQTNMDQQSVNKLKEELTKFTNWLVKDAQRKYFAKEYETQSQEYIDLARHSV